MLAAVGPRTTVRGTTADNVLPSIFCLLGCSCYLVWVRNLRLKSQSGTHHYVICIRLSMQLCQAFDNRAFSSQCLFYTKYIFFWLEILCILTMFYGKVWNGAKMGVVPWFWSLRRKTVRSKIRNERADDEKLGEWSNSEMPTSTIKPMNELTSKWNFPSSGRQRTTLSM